MAKKVLLADDDPVSRLVMRAALEQLGLEIVAAESGPEAVSAMLWDRFDIIVTDLIMPKVDGWEVIRYARETQKQARIVAVSGGLAQRLDPDRALEVAHMVGADITLLKPVTPAQLQAEVNQLLSKPHPAHAA